MKQVVNSQSDRPANRTDSGGTDAGRLVTCRGVSELRRVDCAPSDDNRLVFPSIFCVVDVIASDMSVTIVEDLRFIRTVDERRWTVDERRLQPPTSRWPCADGRRILDSISTADHRRTPSSVVGVAA